jgi:hypothetical protein
MAYIPKYAYAYQCYRYNYFNVKEEINALFNGKCYDAENGNGKICETIYDIEEKNPHEAHAAWEYFIDHSVSSEVPTVNSPDDLSLISTTGAYDSATGIVTMADDGAGNIFANVGVPTATYPLRDGYYRVVVSVVGISGETSVQHFSGCDVFATPSKVRPGEIKTMSFPFYFVAGSTCPSFYDHFILRFENNEVNSQCKVTKIKLFEVQEA